MKKGASGAAAPGSAAGGARGVAGASASAGSSAPRAPAPAAATRREEDDGSAAPRPRGPSGVPHSSKRERAKSAASASASAAAAAASAKPALAPGHQAPRFHASNPYRPGAAPTLEQLEAHADDLSSDDEAPKNTIGRVPLEWYKDYDHIGYDVSGKAVVPRAGAAGRGIGGDGIDRFLKSQDDPLAKWTIYDEANDEEIVLSARDVEVLKRIRAGNYGHVGFDAYPDAPDLVEREIHPLDSATAPKSRFLPCKWEAIRIAKIAKAIKNGTYRASKQSALEREAASRAYLLWGQDGAAIGMLRRGRGAPPLPAPKLPPPGHAHSYNPPPEYLLTPEEEAAWRALPPHQRTTDFLPKRYATLRSVPLYAPGVRERFERCLDLYLCPRAGARKADADPDSLLPELPDPAQLRPFPTTSAVRFSGHHTGRVRSVCFDPTGRHIASGSDDGTVRLWETATGRCLRTFKVGGIVQALAWNPNPAVCLLAVAVDEFVHFLYPGCATRAVAATTIEALDAARAAVEEAAADGAGAGGAGAASRKKRKGGDGAAGGGEGDDGDDGDDDDEDGDDDDDDEEEEEEDKGEEGEDGAGGSKGTKPAAAAGKPVLLREARWSVRAGAASTAEELLPRPGVPADGRAEHGIQISVAHSYAVRRIAWHRKGDYLAAATPSAPTGQVLIHALTKGRSQCPFKKSAGQVQALAWHPLKPRLLVASQRAVRVYDLSKGELVQKLDSGVQWLSGLEVHPSGDHIVAGSYDHRVVWFDTELGTTPYKTLRYHGAGVRAAKFHPRYPLMATASDDGTVHVFHSRVFSDFLQNPLIVPVKILRGHTVGADKLGVLDACWHPRQPWLLSAGADGVMHLWHNVP